MTSIPPSAPPLPPMRPASAPAPAAEAVPVQPLPPDVAAKLAALKQLTAVVQATARQLAANAQQQNIATVQTEVGALTLKLPVPVQAGTEVVLTVVPQGKDAAPALRLVLVDGKPLQMVSAGQATAAPAKADAPTIVAPAKPALDAPITATVLRSLPGDETAPPRLPQGASFPVRIVAVEPEGTPTMVVEQPVKAAVPIAGKPAAALPPAAPPPPARAALPAAVTSPGAPPAGIPAAAPATVAALPTTATGATVDPTIATPQPAPAAVAGAPPAPVPASKAMPAPPTAQAQSTPVPLPAQLSGVVAANSHAGQPLLQTPLGLVSLATPLPLPAAATVVLQVAGPLSSAPPAAAATAPAAPWSALGEAITVLRQTNPAMAERLVAALPQLGPKLASGLLVFSAALQADGLKAIVGDGPAQALEKLGKRDLAKKLTGELGDEPAQLRAGAGEWRGATLPMFHGGAIEPVRLYLRKPPEDDEGEGRGGEGGGEGARFLVDVNLSQFGRIQLDGLVRRRSKCFDMILRTGEMLPEDMRRDIQDLFARCCDGLGMTGGVAFRGGGQFIEPARQKASAPRALVI